MSVRTGVGGKVDWALGSSTNYVNIPEVTKWTLDTSNATKDYASSSTGGAKQRISGTDDFTLTIDCFPDRSSATTSLDTYLGIKAGVSGSMKAYEASGSAQVFVAPVFIDDVSYDVDIGTGSIISCTIKASRNGALTYPTT
jgi:hypothetical protein